MSPARKSSARKSTSSRASKKTTKKTAKTTGAKKTSRGATAKKTAKKTSASAAKKASKKTAKKPAAKKSTRKTAAKKTTARKATPRGGTAPVARPSRPRKVRPAHFDAKQLRDIREQLERERAELQSQIADIDEESFQGTQSDITGEVSLDEDFADAGTATFDRERALSIQNNIRDLIDQITRAIGKIDDGTYGTCERCGQPIDAARLKALPHASLCMDCKRREERTR